jgi:esterase FrsA
MKTILLLLLGALAGLYLLPDVVAAPEAGEEFVEHRRLRLWSAQTQNRDLVYSTYLRINHLDGTGPGSWVYEWSQIAKYFADIGDTAAAANDGEAARDAYLSTAKFFGIARFPAKTLPGQLEAYQEHLRYYRLAGRYFEPGLIVLDIPFDDQTISGYLHLPNTSGKPPLILWNGGIDTWKGDSYNNIQPYIERGFAVLTFDVLGTGENSGWAAKPDSNSLHSAVVDYMQTYPQIDGRYIAHVGFSFSGYYAARNAITEERLFAVISACGAVHDGWKNIYDGPWEIREALATAIHMPQDNADAIHTYMRSFSLLDQGLIDGPDSVKRPLLVVNGDLDDLAPVSDLKLISDSGRETDMWIMGGDQHCFGQYRSIVMPKMATWLTDRLVDYKAADAAR